MFKKPLCEAGAEKNGWNQSDFLETCERTPRILPSCRACGVEPVQRCVSAGTDGLPRLCWCQTEMEQPSGGRPSEVKANRSSVCTFPGGYLSCLSLQNYRASSPRLLLSSSSSSSSRSVPSRSLCGRPAFVFYDPKSFPSLRCRCCPRSCSPPLSCWFLHIYDSYMDFSSSSSSVCLLERRSRRRCSSSPPFCASHLRISSFSSSSSFGRISLIVLASLPPTWTSSFCGVWSSQWDSLHWGKKNTEKSEGSFTD